MDFKRKKFLEAKCENSHSDLSRKEMKISLRIPRSLNSGWLPTNPVDVNERFSCKSDLGSIGVSGITSYPASFYVLQHGLSYFHDITATAIKSDENIRIIPPEM